jgi:hypothetical protein
MIAIKRLKNIMWILIVALGALSAYLISLRVATERLAVRQVERSIYETRANINYLEVEFGARATMSQIDAWNRQDIRYSAPRAGQFLNSERDLAMLGRATQAPAPVESAPVETAPVEIAPAETAPALALSPLPSPARPVLARAPRPAPVAAQPIRVAVSANAVAKPRPAVAMAIAAPPARPATVSLIDKASAGQRRAMRLSLLDETLLGSAAQRGGEAGPAAAKAGR